MVRCAMRQVRCAARLLLSAPRPLTSHHMSGRVDDSARLHHALRTLVSAPVQVASISRRATLSVRTSRSNSATTRLDDEAALVMASAD
jgi:hypothetical protein